MIGKAIDNTCEENSESNLFNKVLQIQNILKTHKFFIVAWPILLLLALMSKLGLICLMLFMQFTIAFGMHYGLKNLIKNCSESIFGSIISYNASLFLASLLVSVTSNWAYMLIIPMILSSLFAFKLYSSQKELDNV